jgi:ligand-binding sensor domain-containing protein
LYAVQRDTSWTFYEAGPQSLTGSRVNDLQMDEHGRVLIATNEGIQAFDGKTFSQIGAPATGLDERYVNRLYRDDAGKLWACTRRGVYSQSGARWQLFQPEAEGADGLAFDEVRSMLIDKAGQFWFATSRGVRLLANQRWHNFDLSHSLPSLNVADLHGDDLGRIWCATDRGVAVLEPLTEMKDSSDLTWLAFDSNAGLVNDSVTRLLVDSSKRLYLCTPGGLTVVSAKAALHGGN